MIARYSLDVWYTEKKRGGFIAAMAAEIKEFSVNGDDVNVYQMIESQVNQWLLSQNYPGLVYAPSITAFSDKGRTDLSVLIVVDHLVINTLQQIKVFHASGQDAIYQLVQQDINEYLKNNNARLVLEPASVAYASDTQHNYAVFLVID